MKRFLSILTAMVVTFSFCACEKGNDRDRDTDTEIIRPGNNGNPDNNDSTGNDDNTGNDGGDTSEYATYNHTFTNGCATYYGQGYEGQPANITNWLVELADNNYDLENYTGTGYNIVLDLFSAEKSATSVPTGRYTIEAFEQSEFSAGSLLYGFIGEDETYGEYPGGTWLYEGNEGIAAATAGWVEISGSGSNYTVTYELQDDEYMVSFKGSYTGSLTFYDGTQSESQAQAANIAKAKRVTKTFRVRR